jgi:hypothetical protein
MTATIIQSINRFLEKVIGSSGILGNWKRIFRRQLTIFMSFRNFQEFMHISGISEINRF